MTLTAVWPPAPPCTAGELPVGFRVRLDRRVRRRARPDGGVLLGGSPLRVFRLNAAAWAALHALSGGSPVDSPAAARVAGRLVDGGLADPLPPDARVSTGGVSTGRGWTGEVTVVVPVRDRPEALRRCLSAVGPAADVIVVDDASRAPEAVAEVAADAGARLYRRGRNGGPAAARNSGLARCRTPFVAFVDSDCLPEPGWLGRLLPHFDDPAVAAVAPRVTGVEAPGWLGRYEQARSSLDLGDRPGPVAPRSRIGYVPAAALVVRRAALGAGFEERMRVGEDVDLVWRLHAGGWRVRYEPAATVRHDHRVAPAQWAGRKFAYGTSAGPLAARHPGQVPPAVTSVVALLPLVLLRSRHPGGAALAAGLAAVGLARRLPPFPGRRWAAIRLVVTGCLSTGYGLTVAATRAWLPVTLGLAIRYPAARRTIVGIVAVGPAREWVRRRPDLDPLRWTLAHLLDDASYCSGLWVGALRARTAGPLLPAVPEVAGLGARARRASPCRRRTAPRRRPPPAAPVTPTGAGRVA